MEVLFTMRRATVFYEPVRQWYQKFSSKFPEVLEGVHKLGEGKYPLCAMSNRNENSHSGQTLLQRPSTTIEVHRGLV